MKRVKQESDVGIIVGRFQVNELHEGHKGLIESVVNENDRVIIFLGLSPLKTTCNNPLDFAARKQMINEVYPDIDILYINDCVSDEIWSKTLDSQITNLVGPNSSVALYGSRDAFTSHYSGKYPTVELVQEVYISGTSVRKSIAHKTKSSKDFRSGVIWATRNRYSNPYPTVDIAIFNNDNTRLLLGRKNDENQYRFVGGFVDVNESAEVAAVREVQEETHLEIGGASELNYIGSYVINDWRYRGESENILTFFYTATVKFGRPQPDDDIAELKWFELKKLPHETTEFWKKRLLKNFNPPHQVLFEALFDKQIVDMQHLQEETIESIDK